MIVADEGAPSQRSEDVKASTGEPPSVLRSRDEKSIEMLTRSLGIRYSMNKRLSHKMSSNFNDIHGSLIAGEDEQLDETDTLAVTSNAAPHTSKIVNMFEDCDIVFAEDRRRLSARRRIVRWISRRSMTITVVVSSLIATVILWVFDSRTDVFKHGSQVWVWTAIPGMLAALWITTYFVEISLMNTLRLAIKYPNWVFPLINRSFSGYLQAIIFSVLIDTLVLQAWLNLANIGSMNFYRGHQILQSIYIILIGLVVKTILNDLIEMWGAEKTFGKRMKLLLFLEEVVLTLCCRTNADRKEVEKIKASNMANRNVIQDIDYIREGAIRIPLKHRDDRWVFSTDSSIIVTATKDMGLIAEIIFKNIVADHSGLIAPPVPVISLETWCSYFESPVIGIQSFRIMFLRQGNALQNRAIDKEQFVAACKSVFNSRTVLSNRLKGFANLSNLIHTCISGIFWVFMLVIVYRIFGYDFDQLLTAISALILSVAFALSKSISRFVESVVFIFGGKPYQVNDSVSIDGNWYQVHEIGLLDTWFKDRLNKLVRYPNLYLADVNITNLTNSFACVTRITISINFDTTVKSLERLKLSILKYTIAHPQSWKPRVGLFLNDTTKCNQIDLEIRVDSVYNYVEGGSFRVADTELKHHIRKKMLRLGIRFFPHTVPVKLDKASFVGVDPFSYFMDESLIKEK